MDFGVRIITSFVANINRLLSFRMRMVVIPRSLNRRPRTGRGRQGAWLPGAVIPAASASILPPPGASYIARDIAYTLLFSYGITILAITSETANGVLCVTAISARRWSTCQSILVAGWSSSPSAGQLARSRAYLAGKIVRG
jgi:hypothetical protein